VLLCYCVATHRHSGVWSLDYSRDGHGSCSLIGQIDAAQQTIVSRKHWVQVSPVIEIELLCNYFCATKTR